MDNDAETTALRNRLERALDLLREWRDKYSGKEHHPIVGVGDRLLTASPTDLLRETIRILENR